MPTLILKKTAPLEGVVAGEKATLDCPIGPRYSKIIFEATVKPGAAVVATLAHIIGLIKFQIDGKTQREITATELNALNKRNDPNLEMEIENLDVPGDPLAAGNKARFKIPFLFEETYRKDYAAQKAMALPTVWPNGARLGTVMFEIDVPNTTDFTLHDIRAYASVDNVLGSLDASGNPILNLSKWYRETVIYTAAGDRHLVNLPKRDLLQELNFFTQTEDPITQVRVKRDGADVMPESITKAVNDYDLQIHGMNPEGLVDGIFNVVFDRDDLPNSALPLNGVREFEVIITLSSANAANKAITLIRQAYGPRD